MQHKIYYIIFLADTTSNEGLGNFNITIGNDEDRSTGSQVVHDTRDFASGETRIYIMPENIRGRYVTIQFASSTTHTLCEVQVQGNATDAGKSFILYPTWC